MRSRDSFAFGPFVLDAGSRRLLRDEVEVPLTPGEFEVLRLLVVNAGGVVSTEVLEAALRDGGRAVSPVRASDEELDAILAPYRDYQEASDALMTLTCEKVAWARATFERLVASHADNADMRRGLAGTCLLSFEATRTDAEPDIEALRHAIAHAREATRLDPADGDALAILGTALDRLGLFAEGIDALRQAVRLESWRYRNYVRLAAAVWGDERLLAVREACRYMPYFPLAYWLAATVHVARGHVVEAHQELDAVLPYASLEFTAHPRIPTAIALYWLNGLLCLADGRDDDALAAFERELALEASGHIYTRECCANTWYAKGACDLRRGNHDRAREAFEQARLRVPTHVMAQVGLLVIDIRRGGAEPSLDGLEPNGWSRTPVDVAVARAALLVARGDAPGAVTLVAAALAEAPDERDGWIVPIEPLLGVQQAPEVWAPVLALLRARAS